MRCNALPSLAKGSLDAFHLQRHLAKDPSADSASTASLAKGSRDTFNQFNTARSTAKFRPPVRPSAQEFPRESPELVRNHNLTRKTTRMNPNTETNPLIDKAIHQQLHSPETFEKCSDCRPILRIERGRREKGEECVALCQPLKSSLGMFFWSLDEAASCSSQLADLTGVSLRRAQHGA